MEKTEPLLVLDGLGVAFGGVQAVHDMGFVVPRRHIVSLVGPNGAGKTTVLNAISGFVRAQSGSIQYEGVNVRRLPAHRRAGLGIGRTFQDLQLFRDLSVLDNLLIGAHSRLKAGLLDGLLYWLRAAPEDERARAEAREVLRALGIDRYAEREAGSLPFGVQKLAGVARALMAQPRLLLLDEPAAGMSRGEVDDFSELLRELVRTRDLTLLLVEHNMNLVMGLSNHVVVMDRGRRLAGGEPGEVQRDPQVLAAYLGEEGVGHDRSRLAATDADEP